MTFKRYKYHQLLNW